MAITFLEGFDDEAIDEFWPFSPGVDASAWDQVTGPDSRGKAIEWLVPGSGQQMWLATGDVDEVAFGVRLYIPAKATTSNQTWLQIGSNLAGSQYWSLQANNGTTMYIGSQSYTSVTGTNTFTVPIGSWFYLEVHVERSVSPTTEVTITVYVDGTQVAQRVGTQSGGRSDLMDINLTMSNVFSQWKMDDMYVWSGAIPGYFPFTDVRVDRLLPVADGAVDDWTASYANLDDTNPLTSTATNESPTTSGDQLTLEMDTPDTPGERVLAVVYQTYSKGSGRFKPLFRSSGGTTTAASERLSTPADWGVRKVVVAQNPVTAADWTQSDLTTGEFGLELE